MPTFVSLLLEILIFANYITCIALDFKVHRPLRHSFPILHSSISPNTKRNNLVNPIYIQKNVYLTKLSIGSNEDQEPDTVVVSIDTGSLDLWVMALDVQCYTVAQYHVDGAPNIPDLFNDLDLDYSCTANGTFNYKNSKTFKQLKGEKGEGKGKGDDDEEEDDDGVFQLGFADGSVATGIWGKDDVSLGTDNKTFVTSLKFGVVNATSIDVGILGIGDSTEYSNFPRLLKEQGHIDQVQYSIVFHHKNQLGSIEFGDIDESKYDGNLAITPMQKGNVGVHVHSIKIDDNLIQSKQEEIIVDTGSTFSTWPRSWIDEVGKTLNGTYNDDESAYKFDCETNFSSNLNFSFSVNSTQFSIPILSLIDNVENTCYLAVMDESLIGGVIFGADILQHFYTVYNYDKYTFGIAKLNEENQDEDENGEESEATRSDTGDSDTSTTSQSSAQDGNETSEKTDNARNSNNAGHGVMYAYIMSMVPLSMYIFFLY